MFFLLFSHRFLFILCLVTIPVLVQPQAVASLKHMSFLAASPNRNNFLINPPQYPVTRFCDSSDVCFKYTKTNMQPFKVIQMKKANEFILLWKTMSELLIEHLQLTKDGTQLTEHRLPIGSKGGVSTAHLAYVNDRAVVWVSHYNKNFEYTLEALDLETGKPFKDGRKAIEASYLTGTVNFGGVDIWDTLIRKQTGELAFHYGRYGIDKPIILNWGFPGNLPKKWSQFTLCLSDEQIAVLLPNKKPEETGGKTDFVIFDKQNSKWTANKVDWQPLIIRKFNNYLVFLGAETNTPVWPLNGKAVLFNLTDHSKIKINYDKLDSEVIDIKGNVIISRVGKVIKTSTLSEPNTFKTLSAKEDYSQVHWAIDLSAY